MSRERTGRPGTGPVALGGGGGGEGSSRTWSLGGGHRGLTSEGSEWAEAEATALGAWDC